MAQLAISDPRRIPEATFASQPLLRRWVPSGPTFAASAVLGLSTNSPSSAKPACSFPGENRTPVDDLDDESNLGLLDPSNPLLLWSACPRETPPRRQAFCTLPPPPQRDPTELDSLKRPRGWAAVTARFAMFPVAAVAGTDRMLAKYVLPSG